MSTLVFDIETIGESWESIDETTQAVLTRWIDTTSKNEVDRKVQLEKLKNQLGFSALTGSIVALGMYDVERDLGSVYFVTTDDRQESFNDDSFIYKPRSEKELLEDFWESVTEYDVLVTFNGRAFDVPFLLHRSVVHAVRPTIELQRKRYLSQQSFPYHVDLQDELTFYGAMNRRPSLHMFCRAYGITSPKASFGGSDVAELFHQEKFRDIAKYNAGDVVATTLLYKKWKEFLAPASFLNLEMQ